MRISDCSSDVCSSDLRRYADHRSGRDDSCRERRGPVPFGADGRTVSVGPLIFVIVGEPSGDAIGARLMTALKRATGGAVRFAGIGGAAMQNEGLHSIFPMNELSVMGLVAEIGSASGRERVCQSG